MKIFGRPIAILISLSLLYSPAVYSEESASDPTAAPAVTDENKPANQPAPAGPPVLAAPGIKNVPIFRTVYPRDHIQIDPKPTETTISDMLRTSEENNNAAPVTVPIVRAYDFSFTTNTIEVMVVIDSTRKNPNDGVIVRLEGAYIAPSTANGNTGSFNLMNTQGTYFFSGHTSKFGSYTNITDLLIEYKTTGWKHWSAIEFDALGNRMDEMSVDSLPSDGGHFTQVHSYHYAYNDVTKAINGGHYVNYYFSTGSSTALYNALKSDTYAKNLDLINSKAFMQEVSKLDATGNVLQNEARTAVLGEIKYLTKNEVGQFVLRASKDGTPGELLEIFPEEEPIN